MPSPPRPNVTVRLAPGEREALLAAADMLRGMEGSRVPLGRVVGRAARLLATRLEREHGPAKAREYRRRGRVARLGCDPYAPGPAPAGGEPLGWDRYRGPPRIDR